MNTSKYACILILMEQMFTKFMYYVLFVSQAQIQKRSSSDSKGMYAHSKLIHLSIDI